MLGNFILTLKSLSLYKSSNVESFSGNKFNKNELNKCLKKMVNILHKEKLDNWFIAYGTLLGIIRDNSCINNDDDIDIIVDIKNKKKIERLLKKYNFKKVINKKYIYKIELQKDFPTVDIYFAEVNKNNDYYAIWDGWIFTNSKPFVTMKWNNIDLILPNNYEKKLERTYGKNWRTPQKKGTYGFPKKPVKI